MLDYIGERIRESVLVNLPWVSRSSGLVDAVRNADGGNYPGAKPYFGAPCNDVGDYVNMAPQDGESCIVFIDADSDTKKTKVHAKTYDFETFFRVVVWIDERKINVDLGNMMWGMQSAIMSGVQAVSFNTYGLTRSRVFFDSIQHDPKKIWDRYQIEQEKQGLFLLPYRTFAVRFRLIGRLIPSCFTGQISADLTAC
jgi:hypothetical protein